MNQPVRFAVLSLIALLAAGLVWLGANRYVAERRALAYAGDETGAAVVPAAPTAKTGEPAPVEKPELVVHVSGAVRSPGIVHLKQGARVTDAVEAAGGPLENGSPEVLNLAAHLTDGEKIYVPTASEKFTVQVLPPAAQGATRLPVATDKESSQSSGQPGGKVNINTASAAELERVSGIGPTTAKAIVDYRTKHGPFGRVEDLDAVTGIGTKTMEKLRPYLTL